MLGYFQNVPGTCGVKAIYAFTTTLHNRWNTNCPTHYNLSQSAGWAILGFIDTCYCEEAYKYWTRKYKVVYQSPVRRNRNSGNQFFFIILDTRKLLKKEN